MTVFCFVLFFLVNCVHGAELLNEWLRKKSYDDLNYSFFDMSQIEMSHPILANEVCIFLEFTETLQVFYW